MRRLAAVAGLENMSRLSLPLRYQPDVLPKGHQVSKSGRCGRQLIPQLDPVDLVLSADALLLGPPQILLGEKATTWKLAIERRRGGRLAPSAVRVAEQIAEPGLHVRGAAPEGGNEGKT